MQISFQVDTLAELCVARRRAVHKSTTKVQALNHGNAISIDRLDADLKKRDRIPVGRDQVKAQLDAARATILQALGVLDLLLFDLKIMDPVKLEAELNNIPGVSCLLAQGAFYLFPNITSFGLKDLDFCNRLLDQEKVAAVVELAGFHREIEGFFAQLKDASGKPQSITARMELALIDGNPIVYVGTVPPKRVTAPSRKAGLGIDLYSAPKTILARSSMMRTRESVRSSW